MKFFTRNDTAARKVLAEVKRWAKLSKEDCYIIVESYVNCREQGFALASCDDLKVAFSENRNSDDIVVYFGKRSDFAFNTNIPSEEAWENRKFFGYNEIEKAAKLIVKYLEG
jgi:hypothetical protein